MLWKSNGGFSRLEKRSALVILSSNGMTSQRQKNNVFFLVFEEPILDYIFSLGLQRSVEQ